MSGGSNGPTLAAVGGMSPGHCGATGWIWRPEKINSISFRGNPATELEVSTMASITADVWEGTAWVKVSRKNDVPIIAWHRTRGWRPVRWSWLEGTPTGAEATHPILSAKPAAHTPHRAGCCSLPGMPFPHHATRGKQLSAEFEAWGPSQDSRDGWRGVLRNPVATEINSTT